MGQAVGECFALVPCQPGGGRSKWRNSTRSLSIMTQFTGASPPAAKRSPASWRRRCVHVLLGNLGGAGVSRARCGGGLAGARVGKLSRESCDAIIWRNGAVGHGRNMIGHRTEIITGPALDRLGADTRGMFGYPKCPNISKHHPRKLFGWARSLSKHSGVCVWMGPYHIQTHTGDVWMHKRPIQTNSGGYVWIPKVSKHIQTYPNMLASCGK